MLKLHDTEKFDLSEDQKYVAHAFLTDIHYYLDNGIDIEEIALVLRQILADIDK